jgi:hypothetical protein
VARALFKSGPVKIVPAFPGVLMLLPSLAHVLDRGNYVIDLEGLLLAPSVTAVADTAFPQLRADRPYHQPGDDSRP